MMLSRSPTLRIAIGLVGLCISLVLLVDFLFGVLPDRQRQADVIRSRISESTTVQVAEALQRQENDRVLKILDAVRSRNPDMLSAAVREASGVLVASSGAHAADWAQVLDARSSATRVIVPIHSAEGTWGRTEFTFRPAAPTTVAGWLADRSLWLAITLPLVGVGLVYLYLRRVLLHLNPMAVVPERLRDAFDGLTEGVALLDGRGRVVMANAALRNMAAVDPQRLHGRPLREAIGLELIDSPLQPPWEQVLRGAAPVRGVRVRVGDAQRSKNGMMNCSAIIDPQGKVRGCLATIDDITPIERSNAELRTALAELQRSREQIEAQNEALVQLATRDSLTALLNRRAFFERANKVLQRCASRGSVAVIMVDVDHFKSFNDRYGHAIGDAVLQRVAACLRGALREQDVVARYGGEEFCALMDGLDEADARMLAERVRHEIATQAGLDVHEGRDLPVSASLGICWREFPGYDADLSAMLREADTALYEAKRTGRNRVVMALRIPTRLDAVGAV
jgi:diguanylate cyclase (GGDEF)-like protein/PAS domain S-box-containing protein